MNEQSRMTHPILVLIRGVPGSGKSTLAATLAKTIGTENTVVLDPDATDYDSPEYKELSAFLISEGVEEKFHPYRFLRHQAYGGIVANKVVIWNQAFTNLDGFNKTIANLQTYAEEHGTQLPLLVVEVEVQEPVARQRVAERVKNGGHEVNDEAFARFLRDYRSFTSEGFNTVIVNGQGDINQSIDAVMPALRGLQTAS